MIFTSSQIAKNKLKLHLNCPQQSEKFLKFTLSQMAKYVLKSSTSNSQLELEKLIRKYEGIISFSGDFRMCGHPDNAKRAGGGVGCFVCVVWALLCLMARLQKHIAGCFALAIRRNNAKRPWNNSGGGTMKLWARNQK